MEYHTLFPSFPDEARCWIYVIDRPMEENDQARLHEQLTHFFAGWASHGRPVQGEAVLQEGRLLIVAASLSEGEISGCGIDASVHALEALLHPMGYALASPLLVYYRDREGAFKHLSRSAFRRLVDTGDVTTDTMVFDPSLTTVGQLRNGGLEKPAGQSWHGRIFRIPQRV